ncbi:MAG: alpha/beta hydrolase [Pseudomonadota bacterium]
MSKKVFYNAKSKYKVRVVDLTYRQDQEGSWPVRIYLPEKHGPFPALLDVHGGAWTKGGCTDNEIIDLSLAESGLVVIAIECRKSPRYTYPSQVIDVNYATRWVKVHSSDFNAIPDCIGGLGTSSGGHTLLLSAMRPDDARYCALNLPEGEDMNARLSYLIAGWPVIDPYARYLFAKENNNSFLVDATDAYFQCDDTMKEGNPLLALERGESLDLPPVLIIQGTDDSNVPLAAVDRFSEAYRAAGGAVDIQWFPGMPHGFGCKTGAETDSALEIIKDFICRQLT